MTHDSSMASALASAAPAAAAVSRPATPQGTPPSVVGRLEAVSARAGLNPLATRLGDIQRWLGSDLGGLEADLGALEERARTSGDSARQAAGHLLRRPGKRIRPLCVMLGARMAGLACDERVRHLAVACELVHAATLLHDDVIDEGTERRGAPAARVVYGNSASILAGDFLLIDALERVRRAGDPRLLASLLDCIGEMVSAEALQLDLRGRFEPNRETYLRVIEGKTASLFRWALSAGARLGSLGNDQVAALARAGVAIGLAFQLVDDLLDLDGDAAATGKDLFADLQQGKLTWPLIVASESDAGLAQAVRTLAARADDGHDIDAEAAEVVDRIRATDALEATRRYAFAERDRALEELNGLPEGAARNSIEAVAHAAVMRAH
jgi:octaprenyl-diphosphate synthase